jgi:hypothetical protein
MAHGGNGGHHAHMHHGEGFAGIVLLLFAHPILGRFLFLCVMAWLLKGG